MLVLSRKCDQEIVIAGNIRVKILEISGNRVRLGVEAPAFVSVLREELLTSQSALQQHRCLAETPN
ncbi:MAG: Translational regulator CsrA [Planctomycetaceae bacterium]|nr:Translational regulator CsrA [Planctomycetaceae bacterium]